MVKIVKHTALFALFFVNLIVNGLFNTASAYQFSEPCQNEKYSGFCIATGGKGLTYYSFGENLRDIVAKDMGQELRVLSTAGSYENALSMRQQEGVKFAIVQSDFMNRYQREQSCDSTYGDLLKPLRVIMPLYDEEIHILVRVDSKLKSFSDLKGKRIILGKEDSGAALTTLAIYTYMFGEEMPLSNRIYTREKSVTMNDEQAFRALDSNEADAWVSVVGQPAASFSRYFGHHSDAHKYWRLLAFDDDTIEHQILDKGLYQAAKIKADSYKGLLDGEEVATISVKSYLISRHYETETARQFIYDFTRSICKNFPRLQGKEGHEKWKEVVLSYERLPGGWQYSRDARAAFESQACANYVKRVGQSQRCSKALDSIGICKYEKHKDNDDPCSKALEAIGVCKVKDESAKKKADNTGADNKTNADK